VDKVYLEVGALDGRDREAFRRLFSLLSDLEEIAVLAAERGAGVEGQLEDELVHKNTFSQLARLCGGTEPVAASVKDLTDWVSGLRGAYSYTILNIVAEHWLETIFHHLTRWNLLGSLFESIEEDEHRHVEGAKGKGVEEDPTIGAYVQVLEKKLHRIASDPNFLYPMLWISSVDKMTELASDLHNKHKEVCGFLAADHSDYFNEMMLCRAEAEDDVEPLLLPNTSWRQSAFNIDLQQMGGWMEIKWQWSKEASEVEARFLRAISRTLADKPELNLTFNHLRKEVYLARDTIVGVRRRDDDGIYTVHVKNPGDDLRQVKKHIRINDRRKRLTGFHEIPENISELQQIAPRSRCSTNLTVLLGAGGIDWGFAPLIPYEGNTWSVGVPGEFTMKRNWLGKKEFYLTVGVLGDHRVTDGFELGQFMHGIRNNLDG